MTVWSHLPTIFKQRQVLRIAGILTLCVAFITTLFLSVPTHADQNVTQAISFQGRLLNPSGGYVADGYYNIQFKVYQDTTPVWTESYVNNNANAGVQVKNGYFSVRLGSHTAFGTAVDWSRDDLSLSINVAGSAAACTAFGTSPCVADGEMTPRTHLDAVPFAINAGNADNLGGISASGFIQNSTTVQTGDFNVSGTGKANVLQGNTSVIAPLFDTADSSGTLNIGTSSATSITIGSGSTITTVQGTLRANTIDAATATALNIGASNATSINLAQDVTVAAGKSLTLAGGATNTRPSSPTEGMVYYDTTTHQLLTWNGSKWVSDRSSAAKVVAASNSSQAIKDAADYVATGTNDHTIINIALTAAAGGKVYLAEGTYAIGGSISVPNNTTLAGAGAGTIITIPNSFNADINAITNTTTGGNGTGVTVQDLTLDGNKANQTSGTIHAIYFDGMGSSTLAGAKIANIWANSWRSNAIYLRASASNTVANSTVRTSPIGIYMAGASNNNTITGNVALNNATGIGTEAVSSANTITGNTVVGATTHGIYLGSGSNNTVAGNTIKNSIRGVSLNGATSSTISGNALGDNGGTTANNAIYLISNASSNTITGNTITDSSATTTNYAINITDSGSSNNYIADNTLGGGTISDAGTGTTYANQLDANGKLINKSAGGVQVQTSTNNASALDVQDAAGASALKVDTTTNTVLVAGALDTTAAAGMTIGSTNATSITIGKSSSNITTTVLGTAIFKPTTGNDSTTAFQIQRANGTKMFVADSTNQTITFGNSASGNYTVVSTATGQITKYGTARNTRSIALNAEYTGSVLDAGTGSNNTGVMTSSVDLTNRMNYYKWTTSQGTNQSYDVVVQIPLPSDFDGWASSNPLAISTYTSNTSNGTITLEARDSSNTVQCNFVSVTPGSTGTWATNNSACTLSSGTYTAGDQMTLRIRMQSPTGGDVRVGTINLSYLSKY